MRPTLVKLIVVTLIAYSAYALLTIDRRPDEVKIRTMLMNAAQAMENRNLSGTMAPVSKNYKDNNLRYDNLRVLAAQALRDEGYFDITISISKVDITGDRAVVDLHANVKRAELKSTLYDRDLTFVLAKERVQHAWLIPVHDWRVIEIQNLGLTESIGF